jgi:HlyD family secretion protein
MTPTLIRRLFLVLLVLGLLGAGVCWAKRPKPVAVLLATIDQGRVESSIANTRAGTVEACMRTKLSATMGGRIEILAVKEGDKVKKGQLLMKLWNDDQQAQSNLAMAQVETARKRVVEVCTVAANAEREAERQTSLFKQGFISGSRDEQARSEAQARRAGCDAAKADVARPGRDLDHGHARRRAGRPRTPPVGDGDGNLLHDLRRGAAAAPPPPPCAVPT